MGRRRSGCPPTLPPDLAVFAAQASTLRNPELARLYGKSVSTVRRWRERCQVPPSPRLVPPHPRALSPAQLEEFRHLAATLTNDALAAHFAVGLRTVERWITRLGLAGRPRWIPGVKGKQKMKRATLSGTRLQEFLYRCRTEAHRRLTDLCDEYGISSRQGQRYRSEAGVKRASGNRWAGERYRPEPAPMRPKPDLRPTRWRCSRCERLVLVNDENPSGRCPSCHGTFGRD